MDEGKKWLQELSEQFQKDVDQGAAPDPEILTVRELLGKFGYKRRGSYIVTEISNQLESRTLRTTPDFITAWIDRPVRIEWDDQATEATKREALSEATPRIGWLEAAHVNEPPSEKLITVNRDQQLNTAMTLMQLHDLSQLPVMNSDKSREVDAIISWKSIGERIAMNLPREYVRDCLEEPAQVTGIDTPLFDALDTIVKHGYVLVRGPDKKISGIVTTSDLSREFREMARPFLLVGEIEGNLRRLVHGEFTVRQMRKIAEGAGDNRKIRGSADLTLGDYRNLLANEGNWDRMGLPACRKEFTKHLDEVRKIRNNVMHFNPDGLETSAVLALERMARFVEALYRSKPTNTRSQNEDPAQAGGSTT